MELTLDQALQKGVEAHKAGQVQEAEICYRKGIKLKSTFFKLNNNLGIILKYQGK